MSHTVPF